MLSSAALAAWLGNRLWYRLTRLSIDIEMAEARYLAHGLKLAAEHQIAHAVTEAGPLCRPHKDAAAAPIPGRGPEG